MSDVSSMVVITVIFMALVTWVPRVLPFVLLKNRKLPSWMESWFQYVPMSILAALLAPQLLLKNEQLHLSSANTPLWAGLVTFLIATYSRNFMITFLSGLASIVVLRQLMG